MCVFVRLCVFVREDTWRGRDTSELLTAQTFKSWSRPQEKVSTFVGILLETEQRMGKGLVGPCGDFS